MKTFKRGGIHPHANKLTAGRRIEPMAAEGDLTILLSQSIGAPSKPIVAVGDSVLAGQMIAEAGGFVSAPLHSPVEGKVKKFDRVRDAQGQWRDAIIITPQEPEYEVDPETAHILTPHSMEEAMSLDPKEIIDIVGRAGIVGLGGATFPTRVKLSIPEGKSADVLLINGAECEPYLTCDDRLMQERSDIIVKGIRLIMRATGVKRCVIGIEENKPEAINQMQRSCIAFPEIEVCVLKQKYPQGGEKQLIEAVTGREVPLGGLPVDCGCIVDNVATAAAIAEAVLQGKPLTTRIVTVTGPVGRFIGGNYEVTIGMTIRQLLERAALDTSNIGDMRGGFGKVIAGGPMMGRAVSNLDAPVTKGLGGLLVLPEDMSLRKPMQECIRCTACVDVCPMGLEPYHLMNLAEFAQWPQMQVRNVMACVECGSCSFVCPSHRPILDYIKLGKIELRKK